MRSASGLHLALLAVVVALLSATLSARAAPEASAARTLPSPIEGSNTCASCHATLTDPKLRAAAKDFSGSVHRDERIGCVGCHNGDPRDPTAGAHDKASGFEAHPSHAEVSVICGRCHSDAVLMRRINGRIPVGQAALFQLSIHGRLSAAGDTRAPNCAACHGTHAIVPPSSPLSPVNRWNVARVCGGCHGDAKPVAKGDLSGGAFGKWSKSVHGEAFRKGNANAPTCTGCHGAHSAAPSDAASVGRACGRCHEEEMGFFEQSPHSKAFRQRGLAACVVCHGNHDIAPATALLVGTSPDATCMRCHGNDDKPRKVADDISKLLRGTAARAADARAEIARAQAAGLQVRGASYALDRVATSELKLRGVVHTLDAARVEERVAEVDRAIADTLRRVAETERTRKVERRGYRIALTLAGLLFVMLVLKAWQLDIRRRRGAS